jgi:1-acyl-sn-glycerol-3-phosphate acyltransferase
MPILPIALVYTDRIFAKPYIVRPQRVRVIVGEPFYYRAAGEGSKPDRESMNLIMDSVRRVIQRNYDANISPAR